ncbi:MAG: hypothetical protein ACKOW9_03530 [Candidatus Paceibacterota bacterium]
MAIQPDKPYARIDSTETLDTIIYMSPTRKPIVIATALIALFALAGSVFFLVSGAERRAEADSLVNIDPMQIGKPSLIKQKNEVTQIVENKGVEAALQQVIKIRDARLGDCHALSHAVGRAAWSKYENIADAFNSGFDVCDFGFYHGVVEKAGMEMGLDEFIVKIPQMCAELNNDGLRYSQCAHGAGHGALYRSEGDINLAMSLCSGFKNDQGLLSGCQTGVSMEYFHLWYWKKDYVKPSPEYARDACSLVQDEYRDSCYEYIFAGVQAKTETEQDIYREAQWCNQTADTHIEACLTSLARHSVGNRKVQPELIAKYCPESGRERARCVGMALLTWVITWGPTMEDFEKKCAMLPAKDQEPWGGCYVAREQSRQTIERGATDSSSLELKHQLGLSD